MENVHLCQCIACGEGKLIPVRTWREHNKQQSKALYGRLVASVLFDGKTLAEASSSSMQEAADDDSEMDETISAVEAEELRELYADGTLNAVVEVVQTAMESNALVGGSKQEEPVFRGAMLSRAEFISELIGMKHDHSMSRASVEAVVRLFNKTLGYPLNLPGSFQNMCISGGVRDFQRRSVQVCQLDCVAFEGEHAAAQECPVCRSSRAKSKTFYYYDVESWLRKLYSDERLAAALQSHQRVVEANAPVFDLHETQLWRQHFAGQSVGGGGLDTRDLLLALSFDGTDLGSSKAHTDWPFFVHCLNFPPFMRYKLATSLLLGVVGGKPKRFDAYMQVLLPMFTRLAAGIAGVVDASRGGALILLRALLILFKGDYEGLALLMGGTGSGSYNPCLYCEQKGVRAAGLKKILLAQNRRHLPLDDVGRRANGSLFWNDVSEQQGTSSFSADHVEYREPFRPRTRDSVAEQQRLAKRRDDAGQAYSASGNILGFKYPTIVMSFPGFDLHMIPCDMSHAVVKVVERLLKGLSEAKMKPKCRAFEHKLGRLPNEKATHPCCIAQVELERADHRREEIFFPALKSFDRKLNMFASWSTHMSSSDVLDALRYGTLAYALRFSFESSRSVNVLLKFAFLMSCVMRPATAKQRGLQQVEMNRLLSLIEAEYPYTYQTLHMHQLHHIVDSVERYGTHYELSNFAIDRMQKQIKYQLHGTHHYEEAIMNFAQESVFRLFNDNFSVIPEGMSQLFDSFLGEAEIETMASVETGNFDRRKGRVRTVLEVARSALVSNSTPNSGISWASVSKLCGKLTEKCPLDDQLRNEFASVYHRLIEHETCSLEVVSSNMSETFDELEKCVLVDGRRSKVFEFRSRTAEQRQPFAATRSSYLLKEFAATTRDCGASNVSADGCAQTRIGRIDKFLRHTYKGRKYEFALVDWFERPKAFFCGDGVYKLWHIDAPDEMPVRVMQKLHHVDSLLGCQIPIALSKDGALGVVGERVRMLYALEPL